MNKVLSDEELVKDFLNGSESAFNRLANRYIEKIYWHARRMLGNHDDADEIVQQVLIVMHKKLQKFRFQSSLSTWIYKITSTRSLNLIKKNKIKRLLPMNSEEAINKTTNADILNEIEEKEKIDGLYKLLEKIPVKQREVFMLRNFNELSYKEISEITGKSIGALKSNYFHALKKLKEMM
jgi:RNA polymerase sigma-70 factor (ECF subfamily)